MLAASAANILVWIVWIVAALALLASGLAVVLFANPFYSALALIGNLASLAVLYLLLDGEFVAGRAGARLRGGDRGHVPLRHRLPGRARRRALGRRADPPERAAIVAAAAIALEVIVVIALKAGDELSRHGRDRPGRSARRQIGELFLSDHLLAFEVTSIVLLVAAVGGVILGSAMPTSGRRGGEARCSGPGSPPT